nr:sororin isoform X3 [Equus caballus]
MSARRTRSGGAAQSSGPAAPSPKSLRRSQRKSGSDLPSTLPAICPKAPHAAPVRKPIVLKKIVAHAAQIPSVNSPRRSPRIAFFLEKENHLPSKEPTKEDLFKTCSVPSTPTTTPVLQPLNVESNSGEDLDTRDLEMSKKVRRSYSRLETLGATSTPGRHSCFGFEGLLKVGDLSGVSPVVCSKLTEVPRVPAQPWAPDTTLPGISPPVVKEKRKKKKPPEILNPAGPDSLAGLVRTPGPQPRQTLSCDKIHASEPLLRLLSSCPLRPTPVSPADAQESKKSESGKLVTSPSVDLRLSVTWGEAAVSSLPGGTSPTTSRKWTPPQSLRGRQRAHSKSEERPVVQPVEEQNPEEPQVSRELDPEPPSSEQKLDLQPEPTVSFLFTLLSTAEPHKPKDPEEDLEIQEGQFLGKEDWGPQRTAKEINQLQNDCMSKSLPSQASVSSPCALGLAEHYAGRQPGPGGEVAKSGETLVQHLFPFPASLPPSPALCWGLTGAVWLYPLPASGPCNPLFQPNSLYESLKEEVRAIQEEGKLVQEEGKVVQEDAQAIQAAALLQQPSSQKTHLLIPQPDVPHDHRNPRQPWPGPSLETGPDLGKTLQQLLSRSLQ